jgi:hypothetical protein
MKKFEKNFTKFIVVTFIYTNLVSELIINCKLLKMKNFRIKEVKNARINSVGSKASFYYPQVTNWLGFFRDIKPSDMSDDKYKGDVIKFRDIQNCKNFITEYKREHKIVQLKRDIKKVYHVVDAEK